MSLALGGVAAPSFAQAPAQDSQPVTPQSGGVGLADAASSAYILGRDDTLEVGLIGGGGFGGRTRVQADGTIQLPLIGKVQAANLTTSQLSEAIRTALKQGGYFADPVVTVEVVGFASRYVVVLGEVGAPGLIPINRPYRLSEILARVGGVRGSGADYLVIRSADGKEKRVFIKDLATGDATQDPYVASGDKIYAPQAETFYIYGQVRSPGSFSLNQGLTVRMALARSGGLTESGSDKKITVTRGGKKVKVDLDSEVKPGDVFVVGERLF